METPELRSVRWRLERRGPQTRDHKMDQPKTLNPGTMRLLPRPLIPVLRWCRGSWFFSFATLADRWAK